MTNFLHILLSLGRLESRVLTAILFETQTRKVDAVPLSLTELASATGLSHVSVIRAIKSLRSQHLLEVETRRNPNRCNIYRSRLLESHGTKSALVVNHHKIPDFDSITRHELDFDSWFSSGGMNPDHLQRIRELYGKVLNQNVFRLYFDEHIRRSHCSAAQ